MTVPPTAGFPSQVMRPRTGAILYGSDPHPTTEPRSTTRHMATHPRLMHNSMAFLQEFVGADELVVPVNHVPVRLVIKFVVQVVHVVIGKCISGSGLDRLADKFDGSVA